MHRAAQLRQQREQQPTLITLPAKHSIINGNNGNISSLSSTKTGTTHGAHNVLMFVTRASIVSQMITYAAKNGEKHITSKTVRNFLQLFWDFENANLTRATTLWKERHKCTKRDGINLTSGVTYPILRVTMSGPKLLWMKATPGHGRRRVRWVKESHLDLRDELGTLQRLSVKFNGLILNYFAMDLLWNNQSDACSYNMVDPATSVQLLRKIV